LPPGAARAPFPTARAGAVASRDVIASFMWAVLLFAGVVGFGRAAATEKEEGRIEGLVLAPVDPASLFVGKSVAGFIYLTVVELIVVPASIVFFDIDASSLLPRLLPVLGLANAGMAFAGTLFSTASQYARVREMVLPLLLFPVVLPVVLAATKLTGSLLASGNFSGGMRWFILMAAFDLAIGAVGAVTFEYVIRE
ncbi:MAG: heme exporter protein CcmB, partial [Acidimicrobiia bacterium]